MSVGTESTAFTRLIEGYGVSMAARLLDRLGNNIAAVNAILGNPTFRGITRAEAGRLVSLGSQARRAGVVISARDPSDRGRLADIPINRRLFGAQPAGNRFQYDVQVSAVDRGTGEVLYQFGFIFKTAVLTARSAFDPVAIDSAETALRNYKELREIVGDPSKYDLVVQILDASRRY